MRSSDRGNDPRRTASAGASEKDGVASSPIPTARGLPLPGNVFALLRDMRGFVTERYLEHGPVFRIRVMSRRFTVLAGRRACDHPREAVPASTPSVSGASGVMKGRSMKTLATGLILVLLSLAAGLGGEAAAEAELRIGVDPDYPPFSEIDDAGRLKGFDIDIAVALCERMEVTCRFVQQNWEGLIPELRAGKFDAIVSSMSITEKRRRLVAFTNRYYSNVVRFVARKGSGFDPAAPAASTIGAAGATIASDWLEENVSEIAAVRLFTEHEALMQALTGGVVDAVFGDGLGFWGWLRSPEGAGFDFVGEGYRLDEGIGIAVRKEDETLRRQLDRALEAILADGTYERINARYFPFSIY